MGVLSLLLTWQKNLTWNAKLPGAVLRENLMLRASRMLQVKNGTQHTRKEAGRINKQLETRIRTKYNIYPPKTSANVCVALRSFLWLSFLIFLFFILKFSVVLYKLISFLIHLVLKHFCPLWSAGTRS